MNPPRTYDELLAAATKVRHPRMLEEEVLTLLRTRDELTRRYWNHGPDMVAALRAAETRLTLDELTLHSYGFSSPSSTLIQLRAVLAALDGKDAT